MIQWKVMLYGIEWGGEDDTSELPPNLEVQVEADERLEAIEYALHEAAREFEAPVAGTEQIVASRA